MVGLWCLLLAVALVNADGQAKSPIVQMNLRHIKHLMTELELDEFRAVPTVTVVYYFKRDHPRVRTFFKVLDRSTDYVSLYHVPVGVVDCTLKEGLDIPECKKPQVENKVFTYRDSKELLTLDLETMFDVNSIMSNILQLVLLREVPIVQSASAVEKYLTKRKGKVDVIFGYMRAIGTPEHRIFMEVAYAYQDKFNFCVCTERKATVKFVDPPQKHHKSTIWLVNTKDMKEEDTEFNSIRFRDSLNLSAFAKFAKAVTLPKIYDVPNDGVEPPYQALGVNTITFYYRPDDRTFILDLAAIVAKHCQGNFGVVIIDVVNTEESVHNNYQGMLPSMSMRYSDDEEAVFMKNPLQEDNMVEFVNIQMNDRSRRFGQDDYEKEGVPVETKIAPPEEEIEEKPDMNIEAEEARLYEARDRKMKVETQDDFVADAVQQTRRVSFMFDRVPALTDKTFPETLASADSVLVFFYFPFSSLSMAFLRIFGESAEQIGDSAIKLARVNCYDWTDVCGGQNITIYPTLRTFYKGSPVEDYRGPKDGQAIYAKVKLMEMSLPLALKSTSEVEEFLTGDFPAQRHTITNLTVLCLLEGHHSKQKDLFESAARQDRNNILFAYYDGVGAQQIASKFQTNLPAVILTRLDEPADPHAVFDVEFTLDNIQTFVQDSKLPQLAELTALRFPEVYARGHPLVILFSDKEDEALEVEESLRQVIKSKQHTNISFTLMPFPDFECFGFTLLKAYVELPAIPWVSYVDLKQGHVFNFDQDNYRSETFSAWLTAVSKGQVAPSTILPHGEWKAPAKGYDFLQIIDMDKQEERKKSMKMDEKTQSMEVANEYGVGYGPDGELIDRSEARMPPADKWSNLPEAETRQELLELRSSRLYHHSAERDKMLRKKKERMDEPPAEKLEEHIAEALAERKEETKEKMQPPEQSDRKHAGHDEF